MRKKPIQYELWLMLMVYGLEITGRSIAFHKCYLGGCRHCIEYFGKVKGKITGGINFCRTDVILVLNQLN